MMSISLFHPELGHIHIPISAEIRCWWFVIMIHIKTYTSIRMRKKIQNPTNPTEQEANRTTTYENIGNVCNFSDEREVGKDKMDKAIPTSYTPYVIPGWFPRASCHLLLSFIGAVSYVWVRFCAAKSGTWKMSIIFSCFPACFRCCSTLFSSQYVASWKTIHIEENGRYYTAKNSCVSSLMYFLKIMTRTSDYNSYHIFGNFLQFWCRSTGLVNTFQLTP